MNAQEQIGYLVTFSASLHTHREALAGIKDSELDRAFDDLVLALGDTVSRIAETCRNRHPLEMEYPPEEAERLRRGPKPEPEEDEGT